MAELPRPGRPGRPVGPGGPVGQGGLGGPGGPVGPGGLGGPGVRADVPAFMQNQMAQPAMGQNNQNQWPLAPQFFPMLQMPQPMQPMNMHDNGFENVQAQNQLCWPICIPGSFDAKSVDENKQKEERNKLAKAFAAKQPKLDSKLYPFLFTAKLSDVVLRFPREYKSICAHKLILASNSIVFETMFQTDMRERRKGEVRITEVSFQVMHLLLRFIYNVADLELAEIQANAIELYKAAHLYQIEDLQKLAEKALIVNAQTASGEEANQLALMAKLYNLTKLRKRIQMTTKYRIIASLEEPSLAKHFSSIEEFINRKKCF